MIGYTNIIVRIVSWAISAFNKKRLTYLPFFQLLAQTDNTALDGMISFMTLLIKFHMKIAKIDYSLIELGTCYFSMLVEYN
jgi:hypothetical protein